VHAPIGLVVTAEVHTPQRHPPCTGLFQIAVKTVWPFTSTPRGSPTFTDSTLPVTESACSLMFGAAGCQPVNVASDSPTSTM
jgi:hypothetical protein